MKTENPYQSPQADLRPAYEFEERPDWSIWWVLFGFTGRIPRRIYWAATIGSVAVYAAILIGSDLFAVDEPLQIILGILAVLFLILYFWVMLAIQIKRWHDRSKSGLWFFINFIPYVGPLWVFVELGCLRGTVGPNQYGPDPT
jgi:uncharacterized membrane protein YhaH (DUF805 family)